MKRLALLSNKGAVDPVLRIASWLHIELVRSDKVNAVVCQRCVGIVSRLSSRSLALINALVVCCSPSPM